MSESSSTLDTVFQTPRDIVNRTIETQESINSQGLDMTRKAVKPLAGAVPRTDSAEEQVDDAFDQLDETQTELLDRVHGVADRTIDTSEDAAEWGYDVLDRQVGRFQQAREEAEETAEEALETAEDTAEDVADSAEDTAEDVADSAEETAEDVADSAEDAVSELQGQIEEAAGELDALDQLDETSFEDLADDGFETLSDLASAQADAVADAADATTDEAEEWIDAAVEYEGESLAELDGIGQTYSDRLADSGVRTIDQLARTSAEEVAETAGVDEDRAAEWVQQAQDAS